jgi:hypothetical protein
MRKTPFVLAAALMLSFSGAASSQSLGSGFTYQGTFADAGVPANGNYDFEFALFLVSSGGSASQTVTKTNVPVSGGLINTLIDFGAATYNGQSKWVEVHVRPAGGGAYTVLAPRQALTGAPYALGLPMPFNRSVNTGAATSLSITNLDGGPAIQGNMGGGTTFSAIKGISPDGTGLEGTTTDGIGVNGVATGTGGTGVRGSNAGATGDGVRGLGNIGVHGVGSTGVWAEGGLLATDSISCNFAGSCQSVVNIRDDVIGNLIIGSAGTPSTDVFRVNGNGTVFANGGFQASGADLAEHVPAADLLEAGDVVEIDAANGDLFQLSSQSNSTAVAGVISTRPGVTLNGSVSERESAQGMPQLALSGRVPVKVTAENGVIHAGDLLVSSSIPGHAMRAPRNPSPGTVIGKAVQKFDRENGQIEMLVMLR